MTRYKFMARKPKKQIFRYKCTMSEEEFKTTREAPQPNELISVASYYELNPEKDDRPETAKKELGLLD
jgi:hypothetical protein